MVSFGRCSHSLFIYPSVFSSPSTFLTDARSSSSVSHLSISSNTIFKMYSVLVAISSNVSPFSVAEAICFSLASLPYNTIIHDYSPTVNRQNVRNLNQIFVHFVLLLSCISCDIIRVLKVKSKEIIMSLQYKINVLKALKDKGYSTYRLRSDKLFSESTIQKFRNNIPVSWENLDMLCKLLECQPNDIIKYVEE